MLAGPYHIYRPVSVPSYLSSFSNLQDSLITTSIKQTAFAEPMSCEVLRRFFSPKELLYIPWIPDSSMPVNVSIGYYLRFQEFQLNRKMFPTMLDTKTHRASQFVNMYLIKI